MSEWGRTGLKTRPYEEPRIRVLKVERNNNDLEVLR